MVRNNEMVVEMGCVNVGSDQNASIRRHFRSQGQSDSIRFPSVQRVVQIQLVRPERLNEVDRLTALSSYPLPTFT